MGLLDRFFKASGAGVGPTLLGEMQPEKLVSLMELMGETGLMQRIESAMQKNFVDSSSYFQAFEGADTQGNFFGEEFNIRATAGRIKSTFGKEPWMYATASLIARSLATVPFKVIDNRTGETDLYHPMNQKLKASNKFQDEKAMKHCAYLDLILGGNGFIVWDEFYRDAMLAPVELVALNLNPQTKDIDSLKLWDTRLGQFGGRTIPYSQCIHLKMPNPYSPFYGLSLFIAASRPLILDRAKSEFDMAFYLRGATNAGIIETTDDINKTRMERLMRTFESAYSGKSNWWRTIFLPKGAKWVKASLTMAEMQHLEGLRENRLTFLATVGVPPSKVGIVQDVNRATSEIQDETFWINTIKPLAEDIGGAWTNSYLCRVIYNGAVRVEPDFSGIEALNGSLVSKGEQAKAIENYFFIDEIRDKVFKDGPLPNGRGQIFFADIRASTSGAALATDSPLPAPVVEHPHATALPATTDPVAEVVGADTLAMKASVTTSQDRIEKKLGQQYKRGYQQYRSMMLNLARNALMDGADVRQVLKLKQKDLAKLYIDATQADLIAAMNRGFSFAAAQTKTFSPFMRAGIGAVRQKGKYRFRDVDQEAIDVLKNRQANGKTEQLVKRAIENFVGFSDTDSQRVMDMIAADLAEGKTTDQIAQALHDQFDEAYGGQADTIARTEVLSAVSQGIKWNHDVLTEVFSDVQKQWFHVHPDKGSREEHIKFEELGPVASDYKWGDVLDFPRDPDAPPDETINCRCSMVSVVPDNATSNAEPILDGA